MSSRSRLLRPLRIENRVPYFIEDSLTELIKQNYSLAKVADRKHFHLRLSLVATAAMIFLAAIATYTRLF